MLRYSIPMNRNRFNIGYDNNKENNDKYTKANIYLPLGHITRYVPVSKTCNGCNGSTNSELTLRKPALKLVSASIQPTVFLKPAINQTVVNIAQYTFIVLGGVLGISDATKLLGGFLSLLGFSAGLFAPSTWDTIKAQVEAYVNQQIQQTIYDSLTEKLDGIYVATNHIAAVIQTITDPSYTINDKSHDLFLVEDSQFQGNMCAFAPGVNITEDNGTKSTCDPVTDSRIMTTLPFFVQFANFFLQYYKYEIDQGSIYVTMTYYLNLLKSFIDYITVYAYKPSLNDIPAPITFIRQIGTSNYRANNFSNYLYIWRYMRTGVRPNILPVLYSSPAIIENNNYTNNLTLSDLYKYSIDYDPMTPTLLISKIYVYADNSGIYGLLVTYTDGSITTSGLTTKFLPAVGIINVDPKNPIVGVSVLYAFAGTGLFISAVTGLQFTFFDKTTTIMYGTGIQIYQTIDISVTVNMSATQTITSPTPDMSGSYQSVTGYYMLTNIQLSKLPGTYIQVYSYESSDNINAIAGVRDILCGFSPFFP